MALFPQLQSRTYVQKGLLTKSLNSLEKTGGEFGQASEEGTALTVKRKAGIFLDKVSSVDLRKNQLEEAFDKLIEHTYELADTDFDPLTAPQVKGEYLNRQMTELLSKADLTSTKYKDRIKEAERAMSQKDPPPSLPPAPPSPVEAASSHMKGEEDDDSKPNFTIESTQLLISPRGTATKSRRFSVDVLK